MAEINIEKGQSLFNKKLKSHPYAEFCWVYSLFNYAVEHGEAVSHGATLNILVLNFEGIVHTHHAKNFNSLWCFHLNEQEKKKRKGLSWQS